MFKRKCFQFAIFGGVLIGSLLASVSEAEARHRRRCRRGGRAVAHCVDPCYSPCENYMQSHYYSPCDGGDVYNGYSGGQGPMEYWGEGPPPEPQWRGSPVMPYEGRGAYGDGFRNDQRGSTNDGFRNDQRGSANDGDREGQRDSANDRSGEDQTIPPPPAPKSET